MSGRRGTPCNGAGLRWRPPWQSHSHSHSHWHRILR
jgi:hypothetical protein